MRTPPRPFRMLAFTLCLAMPALAACGSSGSSGGSSTPTTAAGAGNTIASKFVLGGTPQCATREFCLLGLQSKYGLYFKKFKALDTGGPITVAAIKDGSVDVGQLFTTDGQIAANGWVLLQDDKVLQPADNVTPVLRKDVVSAYGTQFTNLVNAVTAKLTTEELTKMNKQTSIDKTDPADVAKQWLDDNSFKVVGRVAKTGPTIKIGSADFTETVTLAEIYAEWLRRNGYPVTVKNRIGSREIYMPALKRGEINFFPEYAGSLLGTYLKVPATTDPNTNAQKLATALAPLGLVALNYAKAQDINGFVVTKETADKYGLTKLSDLAKPAP